MADPTLDNDELLLLLQRRMHECHKPLMRAGANPSQLDDTEVIKLMVDYKDALDCVDSVEAKLNILASARGFGTVREPTFP